MKGVGVAWRYAENGKLAAPSLNVVTEEMVSPHGTQMLAALVIDEAVKRGWNVRLFTALYNRARSSWAGFLSQRKVRVHHPGFWLLTRYHLPHRVISRLLWRHVRYARPSLIWSPDNEPLTCHALADMPPNAPMFFVHDPSEASPDYPHYPRLWFEVAHRVAGLTVHGRRQAESARGYYRLDRPVEVVWPSSFPPRRTLKPPGVDGVVRFAVLGRMHAQKGAFFAIGALSRLRGMGVEAELHIRGDGPHAPLVRELVASLGLSDRVVLHGAYASEDLDTIIENVDVGVLPSIYEGFGLVMLEFMSRGRPVIATDVGSSQEVLEGLGGGWVVRRADTEDLARAMARCSTDREMVVKAGENASRVWQEQFTPAHMFDRYLQFWRHCGVAV